MRRCGGSDSLDLARYTDTSGINAGTRLTIEGRLQNPVTLAPAVVIIANDSIYGVLVESFSSRVGCKNGRMLLDVFTRIGWVAGSAVRE